MLMPAATSLTELENACEFIARHIGIDEADEALMLDPRGFVATCNSTNFFCVRRGEVYCPGPQYQMAGVTR